MKTFTYAGELYIRVVPSKRLFNSTLIHEVVNRGDVFAVRVSDSTLTIVPGTADVTHTTHTLTPVETNHDRANQTPAASFNSKTTAAAREHLRELADSLRTERFLKDGRQLGFW